MWDGVPAPEVPSQHNRRFHQSAAVDTDDNAVDPKCLRNSAGKVGAVDPVDHDRNRFCGSVSKVDDVESGIAEFSGHHTGETGFAGGVEHFHAPVVARCFDADGGATHFRRAEW